MMSQASFVWGRIIAELENIVKQAGVVVMTGVNSTALDV